METSLATSSGASAVIVPTDATGDRKHELANFAGWLATSGDGDEIGAGVVLHDTAKEDRGGAG